MIHRVQRAVLHHFQACSGRGPAAGGRQLRPLRLPWCTQKTADLHKVRVRQHAYARGTELGHACAQHACARGTDQEHARPRDLPGSSVTAARAQTVSRAGCTRLLRSPPITRTQAAARPGGLMQARIVATKIRCKGAELRGVPRGQEGGPFSVSLSSRGSTL
jgi:hypothetical protein